MTQTKLTESAIEDMAIERLEALGYVYLHGSVMAFDGPAPERTSYAGSCRFGCVSGRPKDTSRERLKGYQL